MKSFLKKFFKVQIYTTKYLKNTRIESWNRPLYEEEFNLLEIQNFKWVGKKVD